MITKEFTIQHAKSEKVVSGECFKNNSFWFLHDGDILNVVGYYKNIPVKTEKIKKSYKISHISGYCLAIFDSKAKALKVLKTVESVEITDHNETTEILKKDFPDLIKFLFENRQIMREKYC